MFHPRRLRTRSPSSLEAKARGYGRPGQAADEAYTAMRIMVSQGKRRREQ
jgi:hypothetical protein